MPASVRIHHENVSGSPSGSRASTLAVYGLPATNAMLSIATLSSSRNGWIETPYVACPATFAALGVIPLMFMAQLAIIVALGVLMDTLLVRALLVPAIIHDLNGRFWWPSALSRR